MEFLGLALSLLIGTLLGLLGGGGSILAVPILVYVLGLDPKLAIAVSLGVVGSASLVGTFTHIRAGNVDFRTALLFTAGSALGAFGGARLSNLIDGAVQLIIFALMMLIVAISMLRGRRTPAAEQAPEKGFMPSKRAIALTLLRGLGVGLLTGIVGVGGGFLIVPALVLLANMPMKRAVGTSLLVITINSASGFIGYLTQPAITEQIRTATVGDFSLITYLLLFTSIAIAGVFVGTWIGLRLKAETLRRSFAFALVAVSILMLIQNSGRFLGK